MKISVAQIRPVKGEVALNIEGHKKLIALSVLHKAKAIFFPELSITGYEPELAKHYAINRDDKVLDEFQEISNKNGIAIGVGMPVKVDAGIQISMIVFQPGKRKVIYSKQQLHADELPFFIRGEQQTLLTVDNNKIAPAICYESLQNDHSCKANQLGAEIYVASVAKSQSGVDKALIHYPAVARKYSMPVLMSNCVGYCDNFLSVGSSAVWTRQGILAGQLDSDCEGILTFDTETEELFESKLMK